MIVATVALFRVILPSLPAAALMLALLNPMPAVAQGSSRFDSMFDDARRFLDQQIHKLDENLPQRGASRSTDVPVPPRNPRRPIELAEPESPSLQPVQPNQPPEPAPKTGETAMETQPPEPTQKTGDAAKSIPPPEPVAPSEPNERAVAKQPEIALPEPAERVKPETHSKTTEKPEAEPPETPPDAAGTEEIASAEPAPDLPTRNPARTGEYTPPPPHPSEIEAPDWTEKQIAEAKAQCAKLLSDETFKFERLDPIRTGICGTPAPVKLTSLVAGTTVKIAPAATLSCPLAASLRRWMKDVVQPAAKQHLGSPIASIRNVASYSCRNRYGGARRPLSEHAKVNAIDIAAFKTESGETVILLKDWNLMIEPDPPLEPADQKESTEMDSDAPETPKDGATGQQPASGDNSANAPEKPDSGIAEKEEASNLQGDGAAAPEDEEPPVPEAKPKPHPKSLFLRSVQAGACGIFGTVLGPESNAAHRDHFHFDAAERRKSYCE